MINEFGTADIVLAATLKTMGHQLSHIDKVGNKGTFYFTDIPDEIISQFDIGQLRVEPVAFNNQIKQLTTSVRRQY